MPLTPQWTELTTQQLVRYEALFMLLDEIQALDDIEAISRLVVVRWKYFASVTKWRLVLAKGEAYLVIDGFRGEAKVAEVDVLSSWDEMYWNQQLPRFVEKSDWLDAVMPPAHLDGKSVIGIKVLPIVRMGRCIGLLSAAARNVPFSELDTKFIRLFGGHFADRIYDILLRRQVIMTLLTRATHDSLTGLLNRGAIIERLGNQLALSRRTGEPLGVILADVDHFKAINDNHGHLVGDAVLRELSRRLLAQARDSDSLGRYGGEEFLFVLYPCSLDELAQAAERFRNVVAESPFAVKGALDRGIRVTLSLGTNGSEGQDIVILEDLLKQADAALYQAKDAGRNRVVATPR